MAIEDQFQTLYRGGGGASKQYKVPMDYQTQMMNIQLRAQEEAQRQQDAMNDPLRQRQIYQYRQQTQRPTQPGGKGGGFGSPPQGPGGKGGGFTNEPGQQYRAFSWNQ